MTAAKPKYNLVTTLVLFVLTFVVVYTAAPALGFGSVAACTCPGYANNGDTTCGSGGPGSCPVGTVCTIACYTPACSGCTPANPPPPPGPPPAPGGWGGCGSCNCNIGNSPAECRTCPSGCCWDPGGCAVTCNPTSPSKPALSSPADGSTVIIGSGVRFAWGAVSWGNECGGTSRGYRLYYRERIAGLCSGTLNSVGTSGTSLVRTNILPDTEYCWYVTATNGAGRTTYSNTFYFTTLADPEVVSYSVVNPNNCSGSNISGRTDSPKTNNPIKVVARFKDSSSDFAAGNNEFQELYVAIVPQSVQNSTNVGQTVLEPQAVPYLGFKASNLNSGTINFASLDSGVDPKFGSNKTSGSLTNAGGTATLLNLNTSGGTKVVKVSNNELEVTWQIRFENTYATGPLNIYVMGTATIAGITVSQDSDTVGNVLLRYTNVMPWQTDMQAPTATIGSPAIIGPNVFTVKWTGNDTTTGNTGISLFNSYCYVVNGTTMNLTDTTLSSTISLPTSQVKYPAASNCLITNANQGNHGYSLNTLGSSGDVAFGMHIEDGACNPSETTQQLNNQKAWILSTGGTVYAKSGFTGFTIQNVSTLQNIVPNLGDDAYLGRYSVISGNSQIVGGRQSKNDYFVTSYTNLGKDPPAISDKTDWYNYLYKIARATLQIQTKPLTTIGGSVSSALGISASSEGYYFVNGNLTINSGLVCDAKVGIFVYGTLTINPDITRFPGNGCVFIVRGDINVEAGTRKTPSGTPANGYAKYDEIHAFLISNGKFITKADTFGGTEIPDGLYIQGGVIARSVDLKRDLGTYQNSIQPSEVFDYDPYYANDFRNIFATNSFSIRAL